MKHDVAILDGVPEEAEGSVDMPLGKVSTKADGWRIVNVFADGVSDAAVRRSQYDSLVGERGIDGLIGFVESQNKNLLRECNGG